MENVDLRLLKLMKMYSPQLKARLSHPDRYAKRKFNRQIMSKLKDTYTQHFSENPIVLEKALAAKLFELLRLAFKIKSQQDIYNLTQTQLSKFAITILQYLDEALWQVGHYKRVIKLIESLNQRIKTTAYGNYYFKKAKHYCMLNGFRPKYANEWYKLYENAATILWNNDVRHFNELVNYYFINKKDTEKQLCIFGG